MKWRRKRRCKHCQKLFVPDYRNSKRQEYCSEPACRKASKAASQARWVSKPENQGYFKGPAHVERVREWRARNPHRKGKKKAKTDKMLQDSCHKNPDEKQPVKEDNISQISFNNSVLQDLCNQQHLVMIGLIANLTGSALQDNIETTMSRMRELGRDIFYQPNRKGGPNDSKETRLPGAYP